MEYPNVWYHVMIPREMGGIFFFTDRERKDCLSFSGVLRIPVQENVLV